MEAKLIGRTQAARMLNVTRPCIDYYWRKGHLRSVSLDERNHFVPVSDIMRLIERRDRRKPDGNND